MDDLIGVLIDGILEWIVGPLLDALVRPLHAKVRRSLGCFLWYAAIICCFGLVLGGFSGYWVNHSSPLGWLIGGLMGGALAGILMLRLARRAEWWPIRPR
ncbi:MAG TPA: hypothetical protein VKB35_08105 [Ktedonobacteraceae bacterium]|nr:hypothetical protein [Ktedonobacteraceae bacterium]